MPCSRKTMKFAVSAAAAEESILASRQPDRFPSRPFLPAHRTISTIIPGITYPTGARKPMLPVMPKNTASMLCTAPISIPQPKRGITQEPITRNIREKLVPIPPGIWRASVIRLAPGAISRLAKSPRSQQSVQKSSCCSFLYFTDLLPKPFCRPHSGRAGVQDSRY